MKILEKYNQSKVVKVFTYFCIALILLFILATLAQYYSTKLNLTKPLIPENLVQILIRPYLIKAIILIFGLVAIFTLNFLKKNALAFLLAIILISYYIFSNHHIGGWHTQIN